MICTFMAGCTTPPVSAPKEETQQAGSADAKTVDEQTTDEVATASEEGLPNVGEDFSGFEVKEIIPMDVVGATGILYNHTKSGAELLYLKSEDTNRSFDITFRTPALDEKGKPHVFEHMTICGSQKYPDANMFFPISNQTYNTYVNAYTFHGMTSYPIASLSEEQLMSLMDYYLSGIFEPLLYTEPRLVEREAWRYELEDKEEEINIAGTVYSEMQGALTPSMTARNNNIKTLYEGSTTAHKSGGVPDAIRTLTYEELVDFHDTYYHPSNALITLYGDLDIESYLSFIDSTYLSKFDKKEIKVDMGKIEPYTETKYAEYTVPVEKDAETKNTSIIYYSFALNGADLSDVCSMLILYNAIIQESSPVMQAIHGRMPQAQISGDLDFDSPSAPYFTFVAEGVNPEDRDLFTQAIDEGINVLASDGVSEDALDSVLAESKRSLLTTQEEQDLGVNVSLNTALAWTYFNDVTYYPTYQKAILDMTKERADALIVKYLCNNRHRAVSVTKPVAGATEQNAAALDNELNKKKESMSSEEIDQLVASSQEFMEWANTPASSEVLSKVINMKVKDLPEEQRHYDITEETEDDVRYLSAPTETDGVIYSELMLDGSAIPIEQLRDVQTCLSLMGGLDTKNHTKEEVSTLITRYLSDLSMELNGASGYQNKGYKAAEISWKGLKEDAKPATETLSEILFDTDFSDTETIKNLLVRSESDFTNRIDDDPLTVQINRSLAMVNEYSAYDEYTSDYGMYTHDQELIKLADTDPKELTRRLTTAQTLLLNRTDATVLLAGDQNTITSYKKGIQQIMDAMTAEKREKIDYTSIMIPRRNEGIINNSTVQMNMLITDNSKYSGKSGVISMLIDDAYMLPQLRNALGAYGAYSIFGPSHVGFYTYRDPNLERSYEIFAGLPEFLRTADLTQEDVDGYIIGRYSSISRPFGLLTGAMKAMKDPMIGCSEEMRLQWMKDAKATTVEDIRASADIWDTLTQNGVRSSSGTESSLKSSSELFDVFIYPDGIEE